MFAENRFGGGASGRAARGRADGPTRMPRGEVLKLRSPRGSDEQMEDAVPAATTGEDEDATRALLAMAGQHQFSSGDSSSSTRVTTSGSTLATTTTTTMPSSGSSSEHPAGTAAISTLPNRMAQTGNIDSHRQHHGVVINHGATADAPAPTAPADSWFGQALEYAAGVALRKNVLRPVIEKEPPEELSFAVRAEAPRFLGSYSRGKTVLLEKVSTDNDNMSTVIQQASIQRITNQDSLILASWWDQDKVLSYTSPEWSDWWIRRCHVLDPGCEMVKLVTEEENGKNPTVLAIAYYERNVVDYHLLANGESVRTTLIRGIRLAPQLNPEVQRRSIIFTSSSDHADQEAAPALPAYKGLASLLFCHILFSSLRYGSQCVGVHCPKNEVAERFYEAFMGKPIARHDTDGRRYYRIEPNSRWAILQQAFRRQVSLMIRKHKQFQQREEKKEESVVAADDEADSSGHPHQEQHQDNAPGPDSSAQEKPTTGATDSSAKQASPSSAEKDVPEGGDTKRRRIEETSPVEETADANMEDAED